MKHITLWILLLSVGLSAQAQTILIPDTVLRAALNAAKPYSVDAAGQCDTAVWNAQPPSLVQLSMAALPNGTTVDLEGIQYLKIQKLSLQSGLDNSIPVSWPGYPLHNTDLDLRWVDVGLFTGAFLPLPPALDELTCLTCGFGTLPAFNGVKMSFIQEDLSGQMLTVPPIVTNLSMIDCNLSQLPPIPNVAFLNVSENPLGSLPTLPAGLFNLNADHTGLTSLPTLPAGLVSLSVSGNAISVLPALPSTLQQLWASRNLLTILPAMPPGLSELYVDHNPIPVLPTLPPTMQMLSVDSCGMSAINYPSGIKKLYASNNPITSLSPFGAFTQEVSVENCPLLTCLPPLPNNLSSLRVGGSGVSCLPNIPPALYTDTAYLGISAVVCNLATSPCPPAYSTITGTTFQDLNNNGTFDLSEQVRPNSLVIAQPGNLLTGSDINGNYALPADIGTFSVTGIPGLYEPVTTPPYAVTFTSSGQVDSLNHIGFLETPGIIDLVTHVTGNNVRPGFNTALWVLVQNVGTDATDAQVQLTFDPALSYLTSNITPAGVNGNVVDWTTPVLQPGQTWDVRVDLYGPPSLVLGALVAQTATATPSQTDQTPGNNTVVLNDAVVGSYDPNDKRVEPELLTPQDVTAGARVDYIVRFQNTGTFPAERVLITDTLPAGVQPATLQFTGSSHMCTWYIRHGVLHVLFNNINLPDSTNDETNSHGYVRFTMQPSSDLTPGDAVENVANIYFDFNEPVITDPAIFHVETELSVQQRDSRELRTWPNPATGQLIVGSASGAPVEALWVLDLQGRVVLHVPTLSGNQHTMDVSGIAPGTYILKARTAMGILSTRFVKQ